MIDLRQTHPSLMWPELSVLSILNASRMPQRKDPNSFSIFVAPEKSQHSVYHQINSAKWRSINQQMHFEWQNSVSADKPNGLLCKYVILFQLENIIKFNDILSPDRFDDD